MAIVPIVAWAVMRGFGLERGFPLDALIAYTPYVAVAALLAAGVALALRNWAAAVVGALALVWLAAGIAPRAIGSDEQPRPGDLQLDVMAANIHHGTADPDALVDLVDRRGVDLLSVEELTPSFAEELRRAGIGARLPHAVLSMHRGASGGGLYSSFPLRRLAGPAHGRIPDAAGARWRFPAAARSGSSPSIPYPPNPGSTASWSAGLHTLPSPEPGTPPGSCPATSTRPSTTPNCAGSSTSATATPATSPATG